jgi:hypothetical protein
MDPFGLWYAAVILGYASLLLIREKLSGMRDRNRKEALVFRILGS